MVNLPPMSNSNIRQPLLLSFTFGYLSSIQSMTTVEQQQPQPRNIGEGLSSLSPPSIRSLKKLGSAGGEGNIYVTVNMLDDEEETGGGNVTELVPATDLDTVAHFSVIIQLPELEMSALEVMNVSLWQTTASKSGDTGRKVLICNASFSVKKLDYLPAFMCLQCDVQTFQPQKSGLWAYVWKAPPPRPLFSLESSLIASSKKGTFNPISSHFTFIRQQGTTVVKTCAAAATDPVPNLLMLEEDQQETTTTPHVHSDVNQFHGMKNSNNNILNICNNQLQLISCEEVAFEPGFSVSLPLMFLENFHHSIGLATVAWIERVRMESERQGFFKSMDDAVKSGYFLLRILVLGGRNLKGSSTIRSPFVSPKSKHNDEEMPPESFSPTSSSSPSKKALKQTSRKLKSAFKTVNQMAVSASQANVKSYIEQKQKKRGQQRGIFFCTISYLGRCLGKTNTEYDTNDPEWGSNLKVKSCLHTSPRTSAMAYGAATNEGCTGFCFLIKPPTVGDPRTSSVEISLYQEKYSIRSGVSDIMVTSLNVPISLEPSDGPQWTFLPGGHGACSSPDEEGVEEEEEGVYACAEEELSFHLPQLPPVHSPLQFCCDFAKLSLPDEVAVISPAALFSSIEYDVAFCEKFASAISKESNYLKRIASMVRNNMVRSSSNSRATTSFRSSLEKKTWSKQFIPTNLHTQILSVDCSSSSCQYGFITAGAPAAHALGFKKGGLLSLETELFNVSQMLERFLIQQRGRRGSITHPGDEIQLAAQRFEELCLAVSIRRAIVTSQALTIVLAAVILKLEMNCNDASKLDDFTLLIGFEGLLSTHGNERGMLEDTVSALRALRTWKFRVLLEEDSKHSHVTGIDILTRVVFLSLPKKVSCSAPDGQQKARAFDVTIEPILFTQGIDMVQTMSNARRSGFQARINLEGLQRLEQYVNMTFDGLVSPPREMDNLRQAVRNEQVGAKNTLLLLQSERCIRALGGARVTLCKSGKDRTAMSVTLEEAFLIQGTDEGNELITKTMVNLLRSRGIRIKIAEKNVGAPVYSFNAIQRKFIPDLYKAPPGTTQDVLTSYKKRDS
eukprot:438542_1